VPPIGRIHSQPVDPTFAPIVGQHDDRNQLRAIAQADDALPMIGHLPGEPVGGVAASGPNRQPCASPQRQKLAVFVGAQIVKRELVHIGQNRLLKLALDVSPSGKCMVNV
jgi:hypothetical protein